MVNATNVRAYTVVLTGVGPSVAPLGHAGEHRAALSARVTAGPDDNGGWLGLTLPEARGLAAKLGNGRRAVRPPAPRGRRGR